MALFSVCVKSLKVVYPLIVHTILIDAILPLDIGNRQHICKAQYQHFTPSCLRGHESVELCQFCQQPTIKGSTINDLGGGGGKLEKEIFFPAPASVKIFSPEKDYKKNFFLEKTNQKIFFPRHGQSKNFRFPPGPPPDH